MKKTALVVAYFLIMVLVSGGVMILASNFVRAHTSIWIIRQTAPYVAFATSMSLGILLYGKLAGSTDFRSLGRLGWVGLALSALLGVLLFIGTIHVNDLIGNGFKDSAVHSTMAPARFYPYLAVTLLLTGLVQPYLEEVAFRGGMFPVAREGIGLFPSIIVVSLIFSLFHSSFMVTSFLFSVCMCVLRYKINLCSCVVAHCSYNLCSVLADAF
ncbi:MAG: CPBP family intramembrane glutamic endopeptidase [Xanthomonadales bacterium]|nr:CPBP family intramembrane glutamic endopeptidase [Xanthomonadales bacterium]